MNRYVCPACGRWLAGQENGCNYCCNCGSTIKFWNKEQKRHFLEEQELFMRIFKVREEYTREIDNDKEYLKNRDGTRSNFLRKNYQNITDLSIIIPLLKEMNYPFLAKYWYINLKCCPERLPFKYLGEMRLFNFKNYLFEDSIIINSQIKKDNKDFIYIEQLKNELKGHKEILDLVYREEEVES